LPDEASRELASATVSLDRSTKLLVAFTIPDLGPHCPDPVQVGRGLALMPTFSERYGYKPVRSALQIESMDEELRNGIWNALDQHFWSTVKAEDLIFDIRRISRNGILGSLIREIWARHLKLPLDTMSDYWGQTYPLLREHFFKCEWDRVYDFVEFVAEEYADQDESADFMEACNIALEREAAGYRFVSGKITPITDATEIGAIESALQAKPEPVRTHIQSALEKLSDRGKRDYRNSVKESISGVEAAAQAVTGKPKATLEDALLILKKEHDLHPVLNDAFRKLYAYTSDAGGIRHAMTEGDEITFEEAKFMLVACSAFVNLVLASTPANVKE